MFDYDSWLESPYTDVPEACEHECIECCGEGSIDGVFCQDCDGQGVCEGNCEPDEPDYSWEPDDRE